MNASTVSLDGDAALAQLRELALDLRSSWNHATETPLPLTNAKGMIVYPGFPADVLFNFRFYSVAAQAILWAAIGLLMFARLIGLGARFRTGRWAVIGATR